MTKNYIEIKKDRLQFVFGELGQDEQLDINFHRTLRIPDDNKKYALPPSLGSFPLNHVEDYANKIPEAWSEHGGIFFPMYQAEAMWMSFSSSNGRPYAIKVATGKVNAVSGETWDNKLHGKDSARGEGKPDYMVAPKQPWLDGFNVGKGTIRQFVAVPLDSGYTVEEQVTGKAEHGGLQIIVYPMKDEMWKKMQEEESKKERSRGFAMAACSLEMAPMKKSVLRKSSAAPDMGMGAGGMMKQDIYEDEYGIDAWDMENPLRVFIHLANSEQYKEVTGKNPPTTPPSADTYRQYSYPWFDYYADGAVLAGSDILAKVDSIASMQVKNDEQILPDQGIGPGINQKPHVLGKKTVKDKKSW